MRLPKAVSMRNGHLFERPMLEPATNASDGSVLLKTPTANLETNGGSQHPEKRKAGGHGPSLQDEIEHLLPTPRVSMHHGPSEAEVLAGDPNSRLETAIEVLNQR